MTQDDELFKDKISQKRKKLKNLVLFYIRLKNIVRKMNIQLDWMTICGENGIIKWMKNWQIRILWGVYMEFNSLIPELSVFDIVQTRNFYEELGFKIEYERPEEKFVFMSFQDSQFMFEQIHDDGWNIGELVYPLGRGINFSIAVDDIEELYQLVKSLNIELYRELTRNIYQVNGIEEMQIEFLIQDPNGYLLRFTN